MTTLGALLAAARKELQAAGIASPALDARLLLGAAAALDQAAVIGRADAEAPPLAEPRLRAHLKRRISGEPISRIFGEKEFWGLPFGIDASTLAPRPETETLVEAVLAEAWKRGLREARICDLGAGSGAILIALLRELPAARGVATDISAAALSVARRNAEKFGVADRMTFLEHDFSAGSGAGEELGGAFDIVVSNPPYIRSGEIAALPPEVRDHDPRLALDGGADGLDAYRSILSLLPRVLGGNGFVGFEVGHDQADDVAALCRAGGLVDLTVHGDLAGRGRVVLGAWRSSPRQPA